MGITARGFDQISAKFTGTSVKVMPGEHNMGIFITLAKRDNEQYQLTHPAAHLGGLLRGGLSVTVGDKCYITCPKTKIKAILHYKEEGWLGKAQNRVEGVVFRYDPAKDDKTEIKNVSDRDVLARIQGNWREKIYFSLGAKSVSYLALEHSNSKANAQEGYPNNPSRPRAHDRSVQSPPSKHPATPQRIPQILVRRHRSHPRKTIQPRHRPKARTRRKTARQGESERRARLGLATAVLHRRCYAAGEAGVDA